MAVVAKRKLVSFFTKFILNYQKSICISYLMSQEQSGYRPDYRTTLSRNAKRQYLHTLKVRRYCILALQSSSYVQMYTAATTHFSSKQLLLFAFAWQ